MNDSLGHVAGDQLLITIAERLRACIRPGDTVARLGGDEFTVLLENVSSLEDVLQVTERILACWRTPIVLAGNEMFASGSIGIAYKEALSESSPDVLLRDADTAMYHAKNTGRANYSIFKPEMNVLLTERLEMENGLRHALERGEFLLHYQPLVDLHTGKLAGAEALIRWQHPTRGLIPPDVFLRVAEESGLIVPIGYQVLELACRQTQEWLQQYPHQKDFTINVNLSGKQIQRPDIVDQVRKALEITGLPPNHLKLEITESVVMECVEVAVSRMQEIRELGVKLALDDFGTGYSSMASLNNFPINTVKIDRSFVQRMVSEEETAAIVATIISLAKVLGLDVTGEGVETEEHIVLLQGMGCDIGQGYYFARPLAGPHLAEKMLSQDGELTRPYAAVSREWIEAMLKAV